MKKKSNEVKNNGVISLHQMAKLNVFTWLPYGDRRTYKALIERESKAKNLLKPIIMGTGVNTRYFVNLKNITKLNEAVAKGYTF